jgi:superfamily II DNA/RNA helicase
MNRLYLTMGAPLLMLGLIMATVTAGMAQEAISLPSINAVARLDLPLNQIGYVPDILATARVTDPQGRVIGAVQKVEIQNGRAKRVEIALLGNLNPIMIDARDLRYDAEQNIVTTDQNVMQLQARAAI